jgi:putative tryptophan/tyrosine transport system substrate-binding protein
VAVRAQQPAMPVIGVLSSFGPADAPALVAAFHKGLGEAGYFERKNVAIEYRWAENNNDRLPALARDLVEHHVAAIATLGGPAPSLAAKAATSAIPIVFRFGADPVGLGLVASLNKPGGNITGVSSLSGEMGSKRFELIHLMVPGATSVVALVNPTRLQQEASTRESEKAARALRIRMLVLNASSAREIEEAFAIMAQQKIEALLAAQDPFYFVQRHQLVALAARYRIPAIYHAREVVEAGGLMSYGPSIADGYRLAGVYLAAIIHDVTRFLDVC